jgi:hypothetical protein
VLLRRLLTLGRVDQAFYRARREEFLARYEEEEVRARPAAGNWYRNTVRDFGKGYVRLVADAHRRRVIDSNTAASYLNVKSGQIRSWRRPPASTRRCRAVTFYSFDTPLAPQRPPRPAAARHVPTLWANIEAMIAAGSIRCVDLVRHEVSKREDAVHHWAKAQADLFAPLTTGIQLAVREVLPEHQRILGSRQRAQRRRLPRDRPGASRAASS